MSGLRKTREEIMRKKHGLSPLTTREFHWMGAIGVASYMITNVMLKRPPFAQNLFARLSRCLRVVELNLDRVSC